MKRGCFHPLPIAAYFPLTSSDKNEVAIPPNTPVDNTSAPTTPFNANIGVPEPPC